MQPVAVNLLDPESLITAFGVVGILVILFAETGLLVGFFLPGDTLLALAGAFAARGVSQTGHLPLAALLIGCPIAAIVGAQVGHYIGVRAGRPLFSRPDSTFFRREYLERAEQLLTRFGVGKAIVLARFVPFVRTFLNPVAGALEVPARRFFVWNVIGGVIWPTSILLAGYWVGESLQIDEYVLPIVGGIIALSVLAAVFEYVRRRRQARSAAPEKEAVR